jgi:hypothetical protein
MERTHKRLRHWIVFGLMLAGLAGCASLPAHVNAELVQSSPTEPDHYAVRQPLARPAAASAASAQGITWAPPPESALKNGQLLVWGKRDAAGLFVSLFAQDFRPWSHIGIISVEADGVYVYDTNSAFVSFSDTPPTESASGGMRHTPFKEHAAMDYIFAVYDPPPGVNVDKVLAFARAQFERGARFDAFFDDADPDALYCSELVALAFEAGGAARTRLAPVRKNRSFDVIRQWLKIHPNGFFLPGDQVSAERQVALWSPDLSPAQIEALFAAQQELAARFGPNTPLGQLMQWNAFTSSILQALSLREAPQGFLDASVAAFAHDTASLPDTAAIHRQIRQLADRYFIEASPRQQVQR